MIDNNEKKDARNKVLNSKMFSKSTTAIVLLKYLFESSIEGKNISASDIGREIFGKKYQYGKSEATVRVNVYHLRKKIKNYYEGEGVNDSVHLFIERGQYSVKFKRLSELNNRRKKRFVLAGSIVLLVMVMFAVAFILKKNEQVWHPVFESKSPTTMYLTPLYGFYGPGPLGKDVFHRDLFINSDDEFASAFDTLPHLKELYRDTDPNYITFEDAAALKPFTRLFVENNSDFTVRNTKDFAMTDIKELNLICLSPMRYETKMTALFNSLANNIRFKEKQNDKNRLVLSFISPHTQKDTIIELDTNGNNFEHAIAAKLKGANDNYCYLFFADHGLGLTALSEYFTTEQSLNEFADRYLDETDEFIALFIVRGKERTNLSMEIVLFDGND